MCESILGDRREEVEGAIKVEKILELNVSTNTVRNGSLGEISTRGPVL